MNQIPDLPIEIIEKIIKMKEYEEYQDHKYCYRFCMNEINKEKQDYDEELETAEYSEEPPEFNEYYFTWYFLRGYVL